MLASLVAALVSALCYGVAAVMQAIAVRAASRRTMEFAGEAGQGVDPGLLVRMLRQGLFLASIAIDLAGEIPARVVAGESGIVPPFYGECEALFGLAETTTNS